jgi:isopentenyl-diphosphate delta-isomerase
MDMPPVSGIQENTRMVHNISLINANRNNTATIILPVLLFICFNNNKVQQLNINAPLQNINMSYICNGYLKVCNMEEVILVDEEDNEVGVIEKMEAHRKGLLHRAFSVFIYNCKGEILLQQRAQNKYHSAGLWTNTCCSHPRPGESIEAAAARRLGEEMGINCDLQIKGSFIYNTVLQNLIEYEFDYILIGFSDDVPLINSTEVSSFRYIALPELINEINSEPESFSFWLREIIHRNLV